MGQPLSQQKPQSSKKVRSEAAAFQQHCSNQCNLSKNMKATAEKSRRETTDKKPFPDIILRREQRESASMTAGPTFSAAQNGRSHQRRGLVDPSLSQQCVRRPCRASETTPSRFEILLVGQVGSCCASLINTPEKERWSLQPLRWTTEPHFIC